MRRAILMLTSVVVALLVLAGCNIWDTQMRDLDILVNQSPMTTFLAVRDHPVGTPWEAFDFSTDGCSDGPIGSTVYDFSQSCWRHDFSYRNLKRIEAETGGDMWNERNKYVADRRFEDDMKRRCETFNFIIKPTCDVAAETFYHSVRLVPPYASDQTTADNPRNFAY